MHDDGEKYVDVETCAVTDRSLPTMEAEEVVKVTPQKQVQFSARDDVDEQHGVRDDETPVIDENASDFTPHQYVAPDETFPDDDSRSKCVSAEAIDNECVPDNFLQKNTDNDMAVGSKILLRIEALEELIPKVVEMIRDAVRTNLLARLEDFKEMVVDPKIEDFTDKLKKLEEKVKEQAESTMSDIVKSRKSHKHHVDELRKVLDRRHSDLEDRIWDIEANHHIHRARIEATERDVLRLEGRSDDSEEESDEEDEDHG